MKNLTFVLVILISSCTHEEHYTYEVTFFDGSKSLLVDNVRVYSDGSYSDPFVNGSGCVHINHKYYCGVREIKLFCKQSNCTRKTKI